MSDKDQKSTQPVPLAQNKQKGNGRNGSPDLLAILGGEPLEGSGFEAEIPEPDDEWRDPR